MGEQHDAREANIRDLEISWEPHKIIVLVIMGTMRDDKAESVIFPCVGQADSREAVVWDPLSTWAARSDDDWDKDLSSWELGGNAAQL